MNLNQLEAFLALQRIGSFTKAAEMLYIPQPTLSNRISQMEKELDTILFIRNNQRVQLTEAGKQFSAFAYQTIDNMIKMKKVLNEMKTGNNYSSFYMGYPVAYSSEIIPELMPELLKKFSHVKFLFSQVVSDEMISALKNNVIDLGITSHKVKNQYLSFIDIDEQEISVILSPEHRYSQETMLTVEQICAEPMITLKAGTLYQDALDLVLRQMDLSYNIISEINDIEAIKKIIKKNLGISLLPRQFVIKELQNNELLSKPIKDCPFTPYKTYLSYRTNDWEYLEILPPIVNEVITFLKKHRKKL